MMIVMKEQATSDEVRSVARHADDGGDCLRRLERVAEIAGKELAAAV